MTVAFSKMILTPYKNGNEPGTWNLTQVNVKFCTLAELDSLSTPSIPFMVRYWESVDSARYLLCFQHLSESRFLFGALNRRSKFVNFCHDLMQNHLS